MFSVSLIAPQASRLGMSKRWGWGPGCDCWSQLRKIPYHMTSWSEIKSVERSKGRGMFEVMGFVFPSNPYMWWSLTFSNRPNICLPTGSGEWIPHFALFASTGLTYWTTFTSTQKFSSFYPSDLLLQPTWRGVCGQLWGLSCLLGLSYTTDTLPRRKKLEVGKSLGGSTIRTTDSKWP